MKLFSLLVALLCLTGIASAAAICPAVSGNPGITDPSGCNVLITIAAGGGVSIAVVDKHPYDGSDDQLVGVINNSGTALSQITLTGTNGPFGFDGDGICSGSFLSGNSLCNKGDATGYGPNGVSFSGISADSNTGTVSFAPSIAANGGTGFFSLEGNPESTPITSGTPEPATLMLMGGGLALLGLVRRNRA